MSGKASYTIIDRRLEKKDWEAIMAIEWTPMRREVLGYFAADPNREIPVLEITAANRPLANRGISVLNAVSGIFAKNGLPYRLVKNSVDDEFCSWRDRKIRLVVIEK